MMFKKSILSIGFAICMLASKLVSVNAADGVAVIPSCCGNELANHLIAHAAHGPEPNRFVAAILSTPGIVSTLTPNVSYVTTHSIQP